MQNGKSSKKRRGRPRILPDLEIVRSYRSGMTLRDCARRYRCSAEAIRLVLLRNGQERRVWKLV